MYKVVNISPNNSTTINACNGIVVYIELEHHCDELAVDCGSLVNLVHQ